MAYLLLAAAILIVFSVFQLADLSNQLSSSVADEFNVTLATISSPSSYVLKVQEQMASIAAVGKAFQNCVSFDSWAFTEVTK